MVNALFDLTMEAATHSRLSSRSRQIGLYSTRTHPYSCSSLYQMHSTYLALNLSGYYKLYVFTFGTDTSLSLLHRQEQLYW